MDLELYKEVNEVSSKHEFTRFLDLLIKDYTNNSDEWENKSIEDFLQGIKSWVEDMEGYYINNNLSIPKDVDWKFFASVLYSGKMYE